MSKNKIIRIFIREQLLEDMLESKNGFKLIHDNIVDQTRWDTIHEVVFQYEDKFYKTDYAVGSTEYQDYGPWESENDITCDEVRPVEKTVIAYE